MEWTGCEWVEQVPERMVGVPVVAGSRVQADSVTENFDGGVSLEELAEMFGLHEGDVRAVLAFAGRLKEVERAHDAMVKGLGLRRVSRVR